METEKLVYYLVKEAIDIGMKDIDMDKSKNKSGEIIPYGIVLKSNRDLFFQSSDQNSPPNPRILEIGLELHKIGGLKLMQQSYYEIIRPFGSHGPNLKWAWNGVGDWKV